MIKRILLPLDPSDYSKMAVEAACKLAKIHDALVTGLVVLDLPGIKRSIGSVPLGASFFAKGLEKSRTKAADERIHALLSDFEKKCKEYGVRHGVHERQGIPSDKILEESKFYDLLVVGLKTHFRFDMKVSEGDTFEEVLDNSVTPILAVPGNMNLPDFENGVYKVNVCIAFDGSRPACRALQRYAQLAWPPDVQSAVKIVMAHNHEKLAAHYLKDAKEYLLAHSFKNVDTFYTDENIINVLNEEFSDWADLIVIGAHSHNGILDFLAGSLAKYLIFKEKKPIFIGQ